MAIVAYRYRGNYLCIEDAAATLVDDAPYFLWTGSVEADTAEDSERILNEIAAHFEIDRSTVNDQEFPVPLTRAPEPPSFCAICLNFIRPEGETPMADYMVRHRTALADPRSDRELTIATLFTQYSVLCERYHNDNVMLSAVESLASALIVLLNDAPDRIDPGTFEQDVREMLRAAGGDEDKL